MRGFAPLRAPERAKLMRGECAEEQRAITDISAAKHYTQGYNESNHMDTATAISSARYTLMKDIKKRCTKTALIFCGALRGTNTSP